MWSGGGYLAIDKSVGSLIDWVCSFDNLVLSVSEPWLTSALVQRPSKYDESKQKVFSDVDVIDGVLVLQSWVVHSKPEILIVISFGHRGNIGIHDMLWPPR